MCNYLPLFIHNNYDSHFFILHCRSSFLKNVLDKVGGYLVELQTLNPTTPNLTTYAHDWIERSGKEDYNDYEKLIYLAVYLC